MKIFLTNAHGVAAEGNTIFEVLQDLKAEWQPLDNAVGCNCFMLVD